MPDESGAILSAHAPEAAAIALMDGLLAWNRDDARATQAAPERRFTARTQALPFVFEGLVGVALLAAGLGLVVRRRWPAGELHPLETRARSLPVKPLTR